MKSKNGRTNVRAEAHTEGCIEVRDSTGMSTGMSGLGRRVAGVVAAVVLAGGGLLLGGCQSGTHRVATYQESQYRHSSTGVGSSGKNVVREESWRSEQRPIGRTGRSGWTSTSTSSADTTIGGATTYQSPVTSLGASWPYDPRRMN